MIYDLHIIYGQMKYCIHSKLINYPRMTLCNNKKEHTRYFGHIVRRPDSNIQKLIIQVNVEGERRTDPQIVSWMKYDSPREIC